MANATDPKHLLLRPAGGRHALVGRPQARMIDLPGDAEIGGQVARANQQNVDAIHCSDRFAVLHPFARFEHDDDGRLGVELRVQLG